MGAAECERLRTTYFRRRRGLRRGCLSATVCVYFPAIGGREEAAVWSEIHQGYATRVEAGIPPIVARALIESDVA